MLSQRTMPKVAILGTGHYVPSHIVASKEIDSRFNLAQGTTEAISGVSKRHFVSVGENAAKLAAIACRNAVTAAGINIDAIDCLVAASGTMDQGLPNNSALIHRELNLPPNIPAFDINQCCLSFITAIDTLSCSIAMGKYQCVLVVAADIASCGLNWEHLKASAIFGDGAAAAVVGLPENNSQSQVLASANLTVSEGAELCLIPAGGSRFHPSRIQEAFAPLTLFHMDGKRIFKLASRYLPDFLDKLLEDANLKQEEIDWVIPHQASHLALSHLVKKLGFQRQKVVDIYAHYANQIAASIPTALDIAVRDGRIQRGNKILLIGTGAGLSLGGMVLEY